MKLIVLLASMVAIILVSIRMREEKVYRKVFITVFYAVFFFFTFYFARSATYFLRGDFKTGPNRFVFLCLLLGALFYFPQYSKEKYERNFWISCVREIGKLLIFVALAVLGFCTQELERIRMSCQIAGLFFIVVFMAIGIIGYFYKGKERAIDYRDILLLFFYAGIYYYFGFVICYKNMADPRYYIFLNIVILFVVLLLILFITASMNATMIIGAVINPIWILIHYFVYQCRGSIFVPGDIRVAGTAFTVAEKYEFFINSDIWRMCTFSVIMIMIAMNYKKVRVLKGRKAFSVAGTLILSLLITGWYQSDFISYMRLPYVVNRQDAWYDEVGYTLGFIEIMKKNNIKEPNNYDKKEIAELAEQYSISVENENKIYPDIVVIMNEAFADIGDVGEIDTNKDYMPFYHSLTTDNSTAVGRTLVSIIGGGTCQSEYEFLTGNSLEFASNVFPYSTEINGEIYSLVSTLKGQGYHAIATHPNVSTNWRRNVVYKYMQFDEMYFIEDYEDPECFRECVTDREIYNKILSWLMQENRQEPSFVFAVTMQNHGGYSGVSLREGEELPIMRNGVEQAEGIDEYLSLIYESDVALEELITKVDMLDRPTIVVMFGDHFPLMTDELLSSVEDERTYENELERLQILRATPYIVHANYDVDLSEIPEYLSVNYLGPNLLKACELEMTAYDHYLLKMEEMIPAFNNLGFLTRGGEWYEYSGDCPEEYKEKFDEFNMLQYNCRYDKAMPEMFALPSTIE